MDSKLYPKLTIGLPVYNGEIFLHQCLDSILKQTFSDFELIISDNASTDSTRKICAQYVTKDNRIKYFRQDVNIGIHRNFNFLLNQAKSEYFAWTAVDDYLSPDFMEKNLTILESNKHIVSSMGKIVPYDSSFLKINSDIIETTKYPKFIRNYVKQHRHKKMMDTFSVSGDFDKKFRLFLKKTKSLGRFYGVHRTSQLEKCIIEKPFINVEVSVFLNLLNLGDFYEEQSTILYSFDEGISSRGIINMAKYSGHNWFEILFPFFPFTKWTIQNFGILLFVKNLDIFLRMNIGGEFALLIDFLIKINNFFKSFH